MNIQDEARKLMAQERQHEEHLQDNLLVRAEESLEEAEAEEERARELLVQERQNEERLQEKLRSRANEEIQ